MRNKLIIIAVKLLYCFLFIVPLVYVSVNFTGCSGSEEDEVLTQRHKDSVNVYSHLQKSFSLYKKALAENEAGNDAKAGEEFEKSLVKLNEIEYELINKGENYFWKKDYDELATSILQDYFTTQAEISSSSLVFEFAKRVQLDYEKNEKISYDREPLPDGSDVPLIRNSVVDSYIDFFSNTDRGRSFIDKSLYRSGKYFPIMRKILKFNNAPEELIYLSVQESGLNPTITSRAGAVGLWQFMPATGISYGLGQDGYRDDRRDFEKATDAAAQLLKDLYKTYDDWYLAFAAYNAGPGRVNKAISRSGSRDFWTLRGYLPGETKNYVPSILALSFVLRNPEEYGFKDVEYGEQLSYDRVEVKTEMSLQKVAELCESDIETIRELNTELTNDVVPFYDVPYLLRIPHNSFDKFTANFNQSSDIDKSSGFEPRFAGNESGTYQSLAGVEYKVKNYDPEDTRLIASKNGKHKIDHKFDKKESLLALGALYDVRPTDIRIWNNLNYGKYPANNQSLSIFVSEDKFKLLNHNIKDLNLTVTEAADIERNSNNINKDYIPSVENVTKEASPTEEVSNTPEQSVNTEISATEIGQTSVQTETAPSESTTSESLNQETANIETETASENTETYESNSTEAEVKNTSEKNTSGIHGKTASVYTVQPGDNLTLIAEKYNVSTSELMEWNSLTSDKILSGQKLKIYGDDVKYVFHTVESGENLTMIAGNYGVSVSDLKDLNELESDVIFTGQKLKVKPAGKEEKKTVKTSGVKKNHTVVKGETLAYIAGKYGVTVSELRKWNNLKSDKLLVGQILKLYGDKK